MSDTDLGTRKTLFVLVIVAGCFAVLWPKVFYPMLVGPTNQRMKPSSLDKGCCDVISDIDVNTIKIMTELCNNIIQQTDEKPLKGPEIITRCRMEVLNKCGIDISAVLQEQVRLGHSFKQIVDAVRSFNGSLCLKYKFGLSPWKLGTSHRVTVNLSPVYVKQERPAHLRPEMLHPALREKGRAIAQPYQPPMKGMQPKFIDGRPGPVPGIRPPMGGAGHVVHPQKSTNSMGIIMPIYTIGIVIFFSYTLMKLLFKKKPDGPGGTLYPPVEPSMTFRREVFESQKSREPRGPGSRDEELDHLRRRLRETERAMERIVAQMAQVPLRSQKEPTSNGAVLANGSAKQAQEHEQPSVKVLGMEMTASCEGGQRWSRPDSPVMPSTPPPPSEPVEPPQEIYLEGALPAQSQLLVADSTTEAEPNANSSSAGPAVILAKNDVEPVEKVKLRNGNLDAEYEVLDDDAVDESKYTTASGATAAERDISEGERTDGEEDMEEEMEKVPEYVVNNGVQQIKDIEHLQDDADEELYLGDDVEVQNASQLKSDFDTRKDELPEEFKPLQEGPSATITKDVEGRFTVLQEKKSGTEIENFTESKEETNDKVEKVLQELEIQPDEFAIKFEVQPEDVDIKFKENKEIQSEPITKFEDTVENVKATLIQDVESIEDIIDNEIDAARLVLEQKDDFDQYKAEADKPLKKYHIHEPLVTCAENVIAPSKDDETTVTELISTETIESISGVIDDVIDIGTRMSEFISAEREADPDDYNNDIDNDEGILKSERENVPLEEENCNVLSGDSNAVKINISPTQLKVELQTELEDEKGTTHLETEEDVNG